MSAGRVSGVLLIACLIALAVSWRMGTQHWLADHTGTDYCPAGLTPEQVLNCKAYGFWSGFGSDLGEYAIIGGLAGGIVTAWRVHTCHRYWWCWRRPLFLLEGTPYKLCHRHHPCPGPTMEEAVTAAEEARDAAA